MMLLADEKEKMKSMVIRLKEYLNEKKLKLNARDEDNDI